MNVLATEPKRFRAVPSMSGDNSVRRGAGDFGIGVIEGVSVITRGEALGHEMWIDHEFLESVVESINEQEIKARFTHPGLSSDGVGQKLGRLKNATLKGDQVFADLHFQEAATKTPDGDLADYVMTLAEETPDDFGLSIVFEHDIEASNQFAEANENNGTFISPDEDNKNNYKHARLARLYAGDAVDSPAANPNGLFGRGQEMAKAAEQYLEYILGLNDAKPEETPFVVDGDRAKQFLARFLGRHKLSLVKGGSTMTDAATPEAVDTATREDYAAELGEFVEAFGAENATEWFSQGLSYEQAQGLYIAQLENRIEELEGEVDELQSSLAAIPRGDDEGAEFQAQEAEANEKPKRQGLNTRIRISGKSYDKN